jgi:hypothetical protein
MAEQRQDHMHRRLRTVIGCLFVPALSVIAGGIVLVPLSAMAETLQRQVLIETKFVEITQNTAQELGLDTRLAHKLGELPPASSNPSSPAALQFGLSPFPSANAIGARLFPSNGAPGTLNLSGALTDAQFQIILDVLSHEKGAKIISAPKVTTPSNQEANIQINSQIPFPRSGLTVKVTPRIGADGTSLDMMIVPQVWPEGTIMPQLPVAGSSKATSMATVRAGETVVLGGYFAKTPERKENLLFFITPQTVDVLSSSVSSPVSGDQIKIETIGTGETIGHVADFKIENLTGQPLNFLIPPLVLGSKNGKTQDYVCVHWGDFMIAAHEIKIAPVYGVCLERNIPPLDKGVTGDYVVNTGDTTIPVNRDWRISSKGTSDLLRIAESKYQAVDKLEGDGAFKNFPYQNKQEQKDIATQWSVWSDPRICQITGAQPATKEDFEKVVYKQVEQHGPITPETKKKIDQADDAMWSGIQLASAKAKDIEKRDESAGTPPAPINVADNTSSPPPKTETMPQSSPPPEKPAGQDKTGPNDDLPEESYDALDKAKGNYLSGLWQFERKLSVDLTALRDDLFNPKIWSSPDYKKKLATYNKLLVDVPKEFTKTKEGKRLFDQWLETYEKVYKTGKKVPKFLVPGTADPYLKPVAKGDEIAYKKQALDFAQLDLDKENTKYSLMQQDAVANSDAVKKFEAQIEKEYGKGIQADSGKLKQLHADLGNAQKQVAKDWASTDEAKDQMKKVQQAEKDLDKAKEAFKPYEQLEEKPAKPTKP